MAQGLGMNTRYWVAGAALLLAVQSVAESARGDEAGPSPSAALSERFSPSLSAGVAVVATGYEQYGVGTMSRAGVDGKLGAFDQRLGAMLSFTRFTIAGAALDLLGLEASYRVYPLKLPLYASASGGLVLLRESFDVRLPGGRTIDDVLMRMGTPVGIALGVTLFRHLELEAGYRHAFFLSGDGPASFGQAAIALGGRL
jgi:hypothetical protein